MELKFTPTVIIPKETTKKITAIVIDYDIVSYNDKHYNITDKSKSVKGLTSCYTIAGHGLGAGVLLNSTRAYTGENPKCRPYKIGDTVIGRLNDNQNFVINTIKTLKKYAQR